MDNTEFKKIQSMTQGMSNSSSKELQIVEKMSSTKLMETKKGFKDEVFIPSEDQMKFLRAIFNPKTGTVLEDWAEKAHLSESTVAKWWNDDDFVRWITGEAERRMLLFRLEWLAIGIKKMHLNVSTWQTMKDLFFPKGVEHSPSEKGSKRAALEQEIKGLLEKKNSE